MSLKGQSAPLFCIYSCSQGLYQPIEQTYNGIDFIKASAGQFIFGTTHDSSCWQKTERQHHISLMNDFWVSRYEISQGQWQEVGSTYLISKLKLAKNIQRRSK